MPKLSDTQIDVLKAIKAGRVYRVDFMPPGRAPYQSYRDDKKNDRGHDANVTRTVEALWKYEPTLIEIGERSGYRRKLHITEAGTALLAGIARQGAADAAAFMRGIGK